MTRLRTLGVAVVLIMVAFFVGLFVGRGAVGGLEGEIRNMEDQAQSLRSRLSESEARRGIVDAMAGLSRAYGDVVDANFGNARTALERVRAEIESAYEAAADNETLRTALEGIRERLNEVQEDIVAYRHVAKDKIARILEDLRRLIGD